MRYTRIHLTPLTCKQKQLKINLNFLEIKFRFATKFQRYEFIYREYGILKGTFFWIISSVENLIDLKWNKRALNISYESIWVAFAFMICEVSER